MSKRATIDNKVKNCPNLEEETAFLGCEVLLEYVPQPTYDPMSAVEPAVILRVLPARADSNDTQSSHTSQRTQPGDFKMSVPYALIVYVTANSVA